MVSRLKRKLGLEKRLGNFGGATALAYCPPRQAGKLKRDGRRIGIVLVWT